MPWIESLPETYVGALGAPTDLEELQQLAEAANVAVTGSSTTTVDELRTRLREPGFDPSEGAISVRSARGELVAAAMFQIRAPWVQSWTDAWVSPDHLGRGIGGAIVTWSLDTARSRVPEAPDGTRVVAAMGANLRNERARRLFESRGFDTARYFLEMQIDLDHRIEVTPPPAGVTIRHIEPGEDIAPLATAVAASFRDHFGFTEEPLELRVARWENWRRNELWDEELVWLAEAGGSIVGFNVCLRHQGALEDHGYVASLGIVRDWRGQGLARHLLTTSFAEYARRGKSAVALDVDGDSITGATRLYEGVGMRTVDTHLDYESEIRPGDDIVVR